jgi:IclR family acetate operon transcriptional repressor
MNAMAESDSGGERYTVRSVARALGILDELATAPQEGRSVTEVAETSGLSKSATFAVLQTMISLNFVADSGTGQNRRYHLGMALTRLGDLAREQLSIRAVARPVLQQLSSDLHGSVRLGILDEDHVSMIDRVDAPSGMRIDLRMGNEELLHSTAVGKAILAALDDQQVNQLLGDRPLVRQTPHTLTTKRAVLKDLQAIRGRGYSIDDEEDFEGVLCLGAAIRDNTGAPVAAISVTTLKAHATPKRLEHVGSALAAGAGEISARLGFVPGDAPSGPAGKTPARGTKKTR